MQVVCPENHVLRQRLVEPDVVVGAVHPAVAAPAADDHRQLWAIFLYQPIRHVAGVAQPHAFGHLLRAQRYSNGSRAATASLWCVLLDLPSSLALVFFLEEPNVVEHGEVLQHRGDHRFQTLFISGRQRIVADAETQADIDSAR